MGVVKNLMVRIGADVSGVVGGMKAAYSATRQASSQIKTATAGMKQSVKDSFSGSRMSIREYKEAVSGLKTSQNAAVQNAERLQEKLNQMQTVYDSLQSATADLDLSTPLAAQIKEAEESWHGFLNEAQKVKEALKKEVSTEGSKDNSEKIANLRQQLQSLREKASEAKLELRNLQEVAATIGSENIGFASTSGMGNLQAEMQRIQRELEISQIKAGELGQRLHQLSVPQMIKSELASIGSAAKAAAHEGVAQLGSKLKSLGGSAIKGIATLPFQLLNIGNSAATGNSSLEKMVRSIRNIGIVSLGMRVVGGIFRGVFGELQGIISNYISQNEQLSATISSMKTQLGQALAPAINAVIAVMQRLLPVVQTVASVINSIFTALFGKVKTTTSSIKSTATAAKSAASTAVAAAKQLDLYSFDQINRESDDSQDTGTTDSVEVPGLEDIFDFGETPEWLQSVLDWIEQLKEAFKAGDWEGLGRIFGEGINKAVDAINAVDIGTKVGTFVNNLFTTLNSALATIDFFNIGKKVGEFVTAGFQAINWTTVGETIGRALTALPSVIVGFIQNTDWGLVGQSLSNMLSSALNTVGEWLRSVDWLRIGDSIWQFIQGIDFGSIAQGFFNFFGSALRAGVEIIAGFIGGIVNDIKEFFAKRIEECGGNVAEGFLQGLFDGLCNIGEWIYDNLVNPFFSALCSGFGIHSPSTIMHEHGINVIQGFFNGLLEAFGNIGEWISTNIVTPFLTCFTELFGISDEGSILKESGMTLITGLLEGISETWESIDVYLESKIDVLQQKLTAGWTKIKSATTSSWTAITSSVSNMMQTMQTSAAQRMEALRLNLTSAWANIKADGAAHLTELVQRVKTDFQSIRTEGSAIFNQMRNELQHIWSGITSMLGSAWSNMSGQFQKVLSTMSSHADSAWTKIRTVFTNQATTVLTSIESFSTTLSNKWLNALIELQNGMSKITMAISQGFSNMLMNVQSVFQAVISGVTQMANAIITSVSSAVSAINKLRSSGSTASTSSYSTSSYSSSGSSSSYSSSSSATGVVGSGGVVSYVTGADYTGGAGGSSMHLATGGITTGPTYALIGEAGKEAVMPLEHNTSWMDTLAQRIHAFGGNSQTDAAPMIFKFYVGGKKISQHVIQDINSITQTTGVCPINV